MAMRYRRRSVKSEYDEFGKPMVQAAVGMGAASMAMGVTSQSVEETTSGEVKTNAQQGMSNLSKAMPMVGTMTAAGVQIKMVRRMADEARSYKKSSPKSWGFGGGWDGQKRKRG